jgi:hypothetical protein
LVVSGGRSTDNSKEVQRAQPTTSTGVFMKSALLTCAFVVALVTTSCSTVTPYKQYGVAEGHALFGLGPGYATAIGYQDYQLNSDTFFVSYTDSGDGNLTEAVAYMNRRAGEVCHARGFSGYKLISTPITGTTGVPGAPTFGAAVQSGAYTVSTGGFSLPYAASYVKCGK